MMSKIVAFAACLLAFGCDETNEICGQTPQDPGARDTYPTSGYGTDECSVAQNLAFTNSDGGEYSFEADVFSDRSKRLLLISTTAGWCSACIEEQPVLKALYTQWKDKGLAVMVAYFEDAEYGPATAEHALGWKGRFELPFPVVADSDPFLLGDFYDPAVTPQNNFNENLDAPHGAELSD